MGAEIVLPDGSVVNIGGGKAPDAPGYELLGAFVGSEGTLGIATKITLRIVRTPESVRTLLAAFEDTEQAGDAVSGIRSESTRLNSSHANISYAVFCLKKKNQLEKKNKYNTHTSNH